MVWRGDWRAKAHHAVPAPWRVDRLDPKPVQGANITDARRFRTASSRRVLPKRVGEHETLKGGDDVLRYWRETEAESCQKRPSLLFGRCCVPDFQLERGKRGKRGNPSRRSLGKADYFSSDAS